MDSNRIDLLKRRSDNLSINVNIQHVEKKTQSVSARAVVVVGFFFCIYRNIHLQEVKDLGYLGIYRIKENFQKITTQRKI